MNLLFLFIVVFYILLFIKDVKMFEKFRSEYIRITKFDKFMNLFNILLDICIVFVSIEAMFTV